MKFKLYTNLLAALLISLCSLSCSQDKKLVCFTGAFLADLPTKTDIDNFRNDFGKKPYFILVFIDWEKFLDKRVIEDTYAKDSVLMVTWEPWNAKTREGINFSELLSGKYDTYINDFSKQLKAIGKPVYLRFAHEANGNWYPWAGIKIGSSTYIKAYRYVYEIFRHNEVKNVKWVFSVNYEDVPQENNYFMQYYPSDNCVDYVGIDGYNWGDTKSWSRWMSFKQIFSGRYNEITQKLKKPVLITEFSSTSSGGNKSLWIKEALKSIKQMKNIHGFVLFNYNKETDWSFVAATAAGEQLKRGLEDYYFKEKD